MRNRDPELTQADERLFDSYCRTNLAVDYDAVDVSDEAIHSYLIGDATEKERAAVEEALLSSKSFCTELLELAGYLDALGAREGRLDIAAWRQWLFPKTRTRFALAASVVVVIVAAALLRWWGTPPDLPESRHLVVLPIECKNVPMSAAFCDGLSATMTQQVSQFERFERGFWVVPSDAVADANVTDAGDASRRFGTTLALTGQLERLDDRYRLTLRLADTASPGAKSIRTAHITGAISELAALQSAAVHKIGEMLDMAFVPRASYALTAGDTQEPDAYVRYVEGRGHLLRYEQVAELEAAAAAFDLALASDSTFALAHTGLAEAYWRTFRAVKDTDWIARAEAACRRSLELDPDLAVTHVTMGNILNESGEYERAIDSFQRAMALDSTVAGAYNGLAASYARLGRLEEAEATFARAIRIKSDYWGGYSDLGLFYYRQGRFEEAAEQYRRIAELTPDNYLAFSNLGAMYYFLERWDEAREAFLRSIEIQPSDRAYINLGTTYYIEGDYETSARYFERAVELNENNYKSWAALGNTYYWMPDGRGRAMTAYRRAIELAEDQLELNPSDNRMRATLASYYVVVGDSARAYSYADSALADSSTSPFVVYLAGYVYEQLGERERALELIGRAVELGYPLEEIKRDPWLVDFRADERFQQLLDTGE